jgi:hypothetical protein
MIFIDIPCHFSNYFALIFHLLLAKYRTLMSHFHYQLIIDQLERYSNRSNKNCQYNLSSHPLKYPQLFSQNFTLMDIITLTKMLEL